MERIIKLNRRWPEKEARDKRFRSREGMCVVLHASDSDDLSEEAVWEIIMSRWILTHSLANHPESPLLCQNNE